MLIVVIVGGYLAFNKASNNLEFTKIFPMFSSGTSTGGFKLNLGLAPMPEADRAIEEAREREREYYETKREPEKPVIIPPSGFSLTQLSPYYDKVRLESVMRSYDDYYSQAYFTVRPDYALEGSVNVTGWKIKGNRGAEVVIPHGIADYGIQGFLESRDIELSKGSYITVYSGKSANNQNFRLNKCTGYLNNHYSFKPSLPNSCPSVDRNLIVSFSGRCQSFIYSIGTCREPSANEKNQFSLPEDKECNVFLNSLNYGGCYAKHRYDADFFSGEWRAWVDQQFPFDKEHDRILLYDRNGLLVDEYVY